MKCVVDHLALKTLFVLVRIVFFLSISADFCGTFSWHFLTFYVILSGGPFYALVGFSLLLVWAVPEALITAELSTAMPEASGSVGECCVVASEISFACYVHKEIWQLV